MSGNEVQDLAARIAAAAKETGLGFLFARVAADELEASESRSDALAVESNLVGRALDSILEGREGRFAAGTPGRALLHAFSLAPDPGISTGAAWEAMANALDPAADAGYEAQLGFLSEFGRLILEQRHLDEPVYRWFHHSLGERVSELDGGIDSEAGKAAVQALLELRDRETQSWSAPEKASPYMRDRLPRLVAESGDLDLTVKAVKGAPDEVVRAQVRLLLEASTDGRALGDLDSARRHAQNALLVTTNRGDDLAAEALIEQSRAALDFEMWRDARDMSLGAQRIAGTLLANDPERPELLELAARATQMVVASLGSGVFDADQGVGHIDSMLRRLARADADLQPALAPAVAELLQAYSENLGAVVPAAVQAETSLDAARIRSWLVECGREDFRVPLSESLGYAWLASKDSRRPSGGEDFKRSLEVTLEGGALLPEQIRQMARLAGELSQSLGFFGSHLEALDLLDRTVQAMEPAVEGAAPSDGFPLSLAALLTLRSTVLAVLERTEEGLIDAERAVALVDKHRSSGLPPEAERATLALRLLDLERATDAVASLTSSKEEEAAAPIDRHVLALARGEELLLRGSSEEAAAVLAQLLEEIDPGGPPPANSSLLFNFFGLELRAGLALAEARRGLDDSAGAEAAADAGARVFLRTQFAAGPQRILHLRPQVLAAARPHLLRVVATLETEIGRSATEEWTRSLAVVGLDDATFVRRFDLATPQPSSPGESFELAEISELGVIADQLPSSLDADWPQLDVRAIELKLLANTRPELATTLTSMAEEALASADRSAAWASAEWNEAIAADASEAEPRDDPFAEEDEDFEEDEEMED
ncbi:MAG: hypothetical protein ABW065_06655 [Solirubrobacterales bacterium]